jgi:hypothetical protein
MHWSQHRPTLVAATVAVVAVAGMFILRGSGSAQAVGPPNAGIAVSCEPSQQAVIRQAAPGSTQVTVQCVSNGAVAANATVVDAYGRPLAPLTLDNAGYTRTVYAPAVRQVEPQVVRTAAPVRQTTAPSRTTSGSSWQKKALVIGGAAGAGAGVGALAGGKKGALIGAAIGGGGAAIFEALKNK